MNPYDIAWNAGIILVALTVAFFIIGPFLSGLLLVVLAISVTANLLTR